MALSIKKSETKTHNAVEEFIPYAAHFDENTVLTKNGELLQTIRITGFPAEIIKVGDESPKTLREAIRDSIKRNIKTDNFSFWFHTIRAQRDISNAGNFKNQFAKALDDKWIEKNKFRTQFVNELYITVVYEGWALPIKNPRVLMDNLFAASELESQRQKFLEASRDLTRITENIMVDLQHFGPQRLGIFKRKGIYYSEIISFISKLMNLKEYDVPLAPADLSQLLPTHKTIFQYNTVQVEGATGKHFGAVMSVKEYHEIAIGELEKLIQLPVNLIITETFTYAPSGQVLASFEDQKKIYDISGKKYMAEVSTIDEMFTANKDDPTSFGEHQTTITIIEDTVKAMQAAVSKVVDVMRDIGAVFVREDLFVENCYWSSLPANFDFIKRKSYTLSNKMAGFCSLYNFVTGKQKDNHWGDAVTVFHTVQGNPYFFNFHYKGHGNTLILSADATKRNAMLNFLLAQAQRFDPRIYLVESNESSKQIIETLGGKYLTPQNHDRAENINAFNVSESSLEDMRQFISGLISQMDVQAPNILVIDMSVVSNRPELKDDLAIWAEEIESKNGMILFVSDGSKEELNLLSGKAFDSVKTKIYLTNLEIDEKTGFSLGMNKKDIKQIRSFKADKSFLINRLNNSVSARFDIDKLPELKDILAGTVEEGKTP